jgi:hypothetical protein
VGHQRPRTPALLRVAACAALTLGVVELAVDTTTGDRLASLVSGLSFVFGQPSPTRDVPGVATGFDLLLMAGGVGLLFGARGAWRCCLTYLCLRLGIAGGLLVASVAAGIPVSAIRDVSSAAEAAALALLLVGLVAGLSHPSTRRFLAAAAADAAASRRARRDPARLAPLDAVVE